jgi:hypothetical protein
VLYNESFPDNNESPGRAVGIATGYVLDDREMGVLSPGMIKNFHFSIASRPALGSTYLTGAWGTFPGGKASGAQS